ncbi:hypothetical protein ACFVY4_26870 [Streptomyces sp. NPDC058299]|uniref:hypothetical protein n=1 Tax=Streptomyces sp. NPDC058299 TaxID=3346435 RepID=UPI0036E173FD
MALPLNPTIPAPDHTDPTFVAAPWTDDQVANLNRYQRAGVFHPFTCGRRDEHRSDPGVLVAERDGWRCPAADCGYRQTWAHLFMATPPTPAMAERERQLAELRAAAARPRPCLLHEDIHPDHGLDCMRAYARWLADRRPLTGRPAREAYALQVEQRILDQLVREHAPAHTRRRINPALSK